MYFYIFDPGKDRELKYFERIQGRLLNGLAEAHVEGESYRVTAIRTVELLVEQAINAEAKTIIVVGSDSSLNRAINAAVRKRAEVTIGFIPLAEESPLGAILGLTADIAESIRILAGRLTQEFSLGKVGEHYFLSQVDLGPTPLERMGAGVGGLRAVRELLRLEPFTVKLSLDNSYTATSEVLAGQIINCRSNEGCRLKLGDPTDNLLDVLLLRRLSSWQIYRHRKALTLGCLDSIPGATVMHAKKIDILGPKKLPLSIEGQVFTKAPAALSIAAEKIKIIVGKKRQF